MKLYGGNCLETPVYWYRIEPEMDCYDFSMVKDVIEEAREAGLHLILLWFGTSKNGHPNYVPEYIKLQPDIYRLGPGAHGGAGSNQGAGAFAVRTLPGNAGTG